MLLGLEVCSKSTLAVFRAVAQLWIVRRLTRMKNLTAKSIQTFVAGALALMGFHALVWTPYYLVVSKSLVLVAGSIFSGLALLIGIAMLTGNERAIFWARIYLLLGICGGIATICLSVFPILPKEAPHLSWWRGASDLLTPAILFWLLAWSRSKNLRDEPVA